MKLKEVIRIEGSAEKIAKKLDELFIKSEENKKPKYHKCDFEILPSLERGVYLILIKE